MGILFSFLPWIVFWILSGKDNFGIATTCAALTVIILNIKSIKKLNMKILDLGTLIFFLALVAISYTHDARWIGKYASPLSSTAIFIIALISIMIQKPFTLQYAREETEEKYWDTPPFYSVNFFISWVWCIAFAVNAISAFFTVNHHSLVDWVVHIFIFIAVLKFTAWYPKHVKSEAAKKQNVTR